MPPSASRAMRAAHGVDDRQGRVPAAFGLAQGAEGVGGLTRLAQHEDERAVVERRIAIAELAGVLDLDRQVGEPLDQVFADERRVPARPAGGEHDATDPAELACREVQPAEDGGGLGPTEPAPAGVDDRIGLLANLLDHVMGVPAQLDRIRLPVQPIDPRRDRTVLEVAHLEVIAASSGRPRRLAGRQPGRCVVRWRSGRWPAGVPPRPGRRPAGCRTGRRPPRPAASG